MFFLTHGVDGANRTVTAVRKINIVCVRVCVVMQRAHSTVRAPVLTPTAPSAATSAALTLKPSLASPTESASVLTDLSTGNESVPKSKINKITQ